MSKGLEKERPLIFEQRLNKQRRNRLIIYSIIILLFVSLVGSYVRKSFNRSFLQIKFVQTGSIERLVPIQGTVIRDEVLINTTVNGNINKIAAEGEKVRKNARVADITTNAIDNNGKAGSLYAPMPGLVSYKVDGLEEALSPKIINGLDLEKVIELPETVGEKDSSQGKIKSEFTGVKIINNLGYTYVLAVINKEDIKKSMLEINKTLRFQYQNINNEKKNFRLRIKRIKEIEKNYLVLLETSYYQQIFQDRKINLLLVVTSYKGIMVNDGAIVYKDNKPGLYVVVRSLVKWVPVKIIGKTEDMTVVENKKSLLAESQYIANPQLTSEGSNVD